MSSLSEVVQPTRGLQHACEDTHGYVLHYSITSVHLQTYIIHFIGDKIIKCCRKREEFTREP